MSSRQGRKLKECDNCKQAREIAEAKEAEEESGLTYPQKCARKVMKRITDDISSYTKIVEECMLHMELARALDPSICRPDIVEKIIFYLVSLYLDRENIDYNLELSKIPLNMDVTDYSKSMLLKYSHLQIANIHRRLRWDVDCLISNDCKEQLIVAKALDPSIDIGEEINELIELLKKL